MLNKNRGNIVDAFAALQRFAGIASNILQQTKDDFAADFKDLYPVIKSFNDNVDFLIKDLEFLPTFPFHYKYLRRAVRGDYLNVYTTFDLTLRRLGESVFTTAWGSGHEHGSHGRDHQSARLPDRCRCEPVGPGRRSVQDSAGHGDPTRGGTVMMDRLTRLQLSIFAIVTVLTVGAISLFYLHLPAAVGIGAYKVTRISLRAEAFTRTRTSPIAA